MTKDPLISVIMPIFNVEKFVLEATTSILNQTYTNLEIIIIDDCSTDNTYEIIEKFAQTDKRIKLYRNDKNIKLVATLNRALQYVTGEYVLRMDGDDISEPNRVEKLYEFLRNHSDYMLVSSQVKTIDEYGKEIGCPNLPNNLESIKKVCRYISPVLHIWLCRAELYKELNGYRNILGAEDYDFVLRVLSSGYKVKNLSERLYSVRIRKGNTVSTIGLNQQISHNYCVFLYDQRIRKGGEDDFNEEFLFLQYGYESSNQKKFQYLYKNFQKGIMMLRSYNFLGFYYVIQSLVGSKYIRSYLFNRIMYRLKILGSGL